MAETIVSPGVLANENDQSFILEQPVQAGAAIVGPTVRGKIGIPTICTSYGDYSTKFGTSFESGSQTYSYFTSISAYNYFNSGGSSLLVTRVVSGSTTLDWTPATSSRIPTSIADTQATANINLTYISASVESEGSSSFGVNDITFFFTGSSVTNTSTIIYINTASFGASTVADYVATSSAIFNFSSSVAPYSASIPNISTTDSSPNLTFTYTGQNGLDGNSQYFTSGSANYNFSGGTNTELLVLETISEGEIMNSTGPTGSNNTLLSGSTENFRWQITNIDVNDGTFNLLIRQGDDNILFPSVLETWGPLSLDPYSPNYIEKIIGNQYEEISNDGSDYFVKNVGDYPLQSQFIRVKKVNYLTPEYLDNNGNFNVDFTGSLPVASSGSFGAGKGLNIPTGEAGLYYNNITDAGNIQGLQASDYTTSISLLSNKEAYKYNFITLPGIVNSFASHTTLVTQLISMIQERGDTMTILDLVGYNSNILPVLTQAGNRDTSYAASYWPWVKTLDPNTAIQAWVPPSTLIPGVYAQNDIIAHPWFAPAGVNRGVMPTVTQTERILTQGNRDDLYKNKINPIATLPTAGGSSVVVFGQKTLQKRKTSLDRVNVRRLLIELKTFISQIADGFVFEQNTESTRTNFLSEINPYLSTVQQQQGLTSFQVIMDETNNTPNVIDNNQLIGQIYLQPTRTAEFIILDFNILPTGATFPT